MDPRMSQREQRNEEASRRGVTNEEASQAPAQVSSSGRVVRVLHVSMNAGAAAGTKVQRYACGLRGT